jgi:hypothetical protein
MRIIVFVTIIIAAAVFFGLFTIFDDLFIHDIALEVTYESVILTITLGGIGIAAAKYYGDETANNVIREVKRMESDLKQRLDNLESKLK